MSFSRNRSTGPRNPDRRGFALIGVLVAVAVVAILAGVLGPMVYRQMMKSREGDTLAEMNTLQDALLAFFDDTGRFPTDAEGLAALTDDPGTPGWKGPYLVGERYIPVDEISTDAFGRTYVYDLDPVTDPPNATDVILVSGGVDREISAGQVDGIWALAGDGVDDLLVMVNSGPTNRDKTVEARDEMQTLGGAAQLYFKENAAFPSSTADLERDYLDASFAADTFTDPWLNPYLLEVDHSRLPPRLSIRSRGPNRFDDDGASDDIVLEVDSTAAGRSATYHMIHIAQAVVDAKTALSLTGDWDTDRQALDLPEGFRTDGWGHPYDLAMSTRTVVSAGPDADYFTAEDNIPPGVIPDDDVSNEYDLTYVAGSARILGSRCSRLEFQIRNVGDQNVTLGNMTLTWPSPSGYYEEVIIGEKVVESEHDRMGTGDLADFEKSVRLSSGSTRTVSVEDFWARRSGENGGRVNMGGAGFTVEFSDGSIMSFIAPACGGQGGQHEGGDEDHGEEDGGHEGHD